MTASSLSSVLSAFMIAGNEDKFINIFEGSYSAYGQTRKTEEFDERGKHKTKSFIIKN